MNNSCVRTFGSVIWPITEKGRHDGEDVMKENMTKLHEGLMRHKIPYSSVSVIYRHQDLGLHCIFLKSVMDLVTDEIKEYIRLYNAEYSFI